MSEAFSQKFSYEMMVAKGFHQKLNRTESQRTPDQVSCDRSIRSIRYSGFFGVRESRGSCGSDFLEGCNWGLSTGQLNQSTLINQSKIPYPWKSNHHFLVRLVSEFHHYFSRGENHHPKGSTIFNMVVDFQGYCSAPNSPCEKVFRYPFNPLPNHLSEIDWSRRDK